MQTSDVRFLNDGWTQAVRETVIK